jgi:hypothetical protein
LPQYSPDLNPIEMVFHPLKTFLRKAAERTVEGLHRCARSYIRALDPSECRGYFRHAGYEPVGAENLVRFDLITESPNVGRDDRIPPVPAELALACPSSQRASLRPRMPRSGNR